MRTRCHISHQWSYTCNVCEGRGRFEKDCQDVEDMMQIKESIYREADVIERQKFANTQAYCQTLIKPELLLRVLIVQDKLWLCNMREGLWHQARRLNLK
ncbi:unnamed protein product [Blepharisma stoltei]|uniref:Uncharacterized protein n=1 Tax=Blepharisma stoltei TaxID=1481888 RepID=A0AAU9K6R6_9CILI|nr:unnamed protein product [Blepharisma stoltei]